jgi:hypothetical protein
VNAQTVVDALARMRGELRESRLLRLGVLAIAGLIWLSVILWLRDAATAKREAWLATEARIARAKAVAASGDWAARSGEVKAILADYETLIWKDGSLGLSQAAAQESLSRSLTAAGLTVRGAPRVALSDAPVSAELPDLLAMRIQTSFDFRPDGLYNWLAALGRERAEKRPAFVVDSLVVRGAPAPVVEAVLIAYTVKPGAGK